MITMDMVGKIRRLHSRGNKSVREIAQMTGLAFMAACATLLRAQRRLRLHIEMGSIVRDVQTLTLFIGNNRLQLQQFGAEPQDTLAAPARRATAAWPR